MISTVDGRNPAPLGNHGKPLSVGIYRGIIISGFLRRCRILSIHTVDGRNPASPEKPWNDGSPVNANKQWLPMVSQVVQDFVHPQYG